MNFENSVEIILKMEAGYVNNPHDPGGETNFGIAKRYHPDLDIANLTKDEAIEIYRAEYWDHLNLDEAALPIRLLAFDCAVNQGVGTAKAILHEARDMENADACAHFAHARLQHYSKSPHWDTFGKGWADRLVRVTALSALGE